MASVVKSCMSGTAKALVLLSTMRLREALRSPGAGFLTRVSGLFFFPRAKLVLSPRLGSFVGGALGFLLLGGSIPRRSEEVVVMDAEKDRLGDRMKAEKLWAEFLKRHCQHVSNAIVLKADILESCAKES